MRRCLTHAVLDGVAFAFRDCLEALKAAGTAGRARHRGRRRLALGTVAQDHRDRARHAGRRAGRRRFRRRLRRGAARPHRGDRRADFTAVCTPPKIAKTIKPETKARDAYEDAYAPLCANLSRHQGDHTVMTVSIRSTSRSNMKGRRARNPLAFRWYDPKQQGAGQDDGGASALRRVLLAHAVLAGPRSLRRRDLHAAMASGGDAMDHARTQGRCHVRDASACSACRSSPSTISTSRRKATSLKEFNRNVTRHRRLSSRRRWRRPAQAALGHRQHVLQPPLHGGRRDQSRSRCLRLLRGAGEELPGCDASELGGENYVMWGGREGYETLLNTDIKRELAQAGRFLSTGGRLQAQDRLQGPDPDRAEAAGADQASI